MRWHRDAFAIKRHDSNTDYTGWTHGHLALSKVFFQAVVIHPCNYGTVVTVLSTDVMSVNLSSEKLTETCSVQSVVCHVKTVKKEAQPGLPSYSNLAKLERSQNEQREKTRHSNGVSGIPGSVHQARVTVNERRQQKELLFEIY